MHLRLALTGLATAALVGLLGCGGAGRPAISTDRIVVSVSNSPPPVVQIPGSRLIVPNRSIAGIRLGESRRSVEKAFGRGKLTSQGWVSYFGGHLLLDYVDKTVPTRRVQAIRTTWGGYRTRSGIHVGSSRQDLRRTLHAACGGPNEACDLGTPGSPGTMFWMRRGKVAWIMVFFVS